MSKLSVWHIVALNNLWSQGLLILVLALDSNLQTCMIAHLSHTERGAGDLTVMKYSPCCHSRLSHYFILVRHNGMLRMGALL